jgi:hypothetical protein
VAGITGAPANESLGPGGEKEEELEGDSRACSPREGANGGGWKRRRWRCSATAGSIQHGLGCSGGPEVEGAGGICSARRRGARDGVRLPQGRTTAMKRRGGVPSACSSGGGGAGSAQAWRRRGSGGRAREARARGARGGGLYRRAAQGVQGAHTEGRRRSARISLAACGRWASAGLTGPERSGCGRARAGRAFGLGLFLYDSFFRIY